MKEEHIILLSEEMESLNDFKEICIYEDEDKKIFISIPYIKETALRQNILDRYDNSEYWDKDILEKEDLKWQKK